MPFAIATSTPTHATLERCAALFESIATLALLLGPLLAEDHEGVEGFDLVFEILYDEFDHDRVVEVSESGNTIGNQIVRIREIGESVQHSLAVGPFKSPILVFEHLDQLAELCDSPLNVFGRVGPLDFFE